MNIIKSINNLSFFKIFVLLAGITFLAYSNSLHNQMLWDDYDLIINNQYVHDLKYFKNYFQENLIAGAGLKDNYWRPFLLVSFALDYKIWELNPVGYHLQNIFWHILTVFLIFYLFQIILQDKFKALVVAILFSVHPLNTEAITYISGRADPMYASFLLLSCILFIKAYLFKKEKNIKWWWFYAGSIVLFVGSLLIKERAIILPILLGWYLIVVSWNRDQKIMLKIKNWLSYLGLFVFIDLGYIFLRRTILNLNTEIHAIGDPNIITESISRQILFFIHEFFIYFKLIFWPTQLHMFRLINLDSGWQDIKVIFSIIIIFLLGYLLRNFSKNKIIIFGLGWFFIFLMPSFYTGLLQGAIAEHWLYLALPGVMLTIVEMIMRMINKHNKRVFYEVFLLCLGLVLFIFTILTLIRNSEWRDPILFYETNIKREGTLIAIFVNLGVEYGKRNQYQKATNNYQKAIEIDPTKFSIWYNQGNLYLMQQNYDKAEENYRMAIKYNDSFAPAYSNLAVVYAKRGKTKTAKEILREYLKKHPKNIMILYNLAILEYNDNNQEDAKKNLYKILEVDPENETIKDMLNSLK